MLLHNTFYKPYEKTENPAETTGLVVVSNRLPVTFDDGGVLGLSSGGLVTAMTPVLKKKGGIWLGWPGTDADVGPQLKDFSENNPYQLKDVPLSPEEVQKFYYGFSKKFLSLSGVLHCGYNPEKKRQSAIHPLRRQSLYKRCFSHQHRF